MNAVTRIELNQNTPEWHSHRASYNNASEAPAVLGISPWFPRTPRQLYEVKLGIKTVQMNAAMARGNDFEAAARKCACDSLGIDFEPAVFVRGDYSASLDGISPDGKTALEIKIPQKGFESDLWKAVTKGETPENYLAQMAQQAFVSGVEKVILWVYDPTTDTGGADTWTADDLLPMWNRVQAAWEAFRSSVDSLEPPAAMGDDEVPVTDAQLLSVADQLIDVRRQLANLQAQEEALEKTLKESLPTGFQSTLETPHGILKGQWITRAGAVDYSKVPQLKGVDLEPFRKASTTYLKLSLQ